MKLYRTTNGFYAEYEKKFYKVPTFIWDDLINRDDLHTYLKNTILTLSPVLSIDESTIVAPVGTQEV